MLDQRAKDDFKRTWETGRSAGSGAWLRLLFKKSAGSCAWKLKEVLEAVPVWKLFPVPGGVSRRHDILSRPVGLNPYP